ncbi:hypothetical protein Dda_2016 [Drechslerella dactyloides]|uniref:Uncharacterized protein n=1 Tax=Drechslerella dactyloides TaxID=74499 RepID=A0AAD6NM99_DREDA|nr:hypothetical protein Dda_2016 [Drechslerella dactyloides]
MPLTTPLGQTFRGLYPWPTLWTPLPHPQAEQPPATPMNPPTTDGQEATLPHTAGLNPNSPIPHLTAAHEALTAFNTTARQHMRVPMEASIGEYSTSEASIARLRVRRRASTGSCEDDATLQSNWAAADSSTVRPDLKYLEEDHRLRAMIAEDMWRAGVSLIDINQALYGTPGEATTAMQLKYGLGYLGAGYRLAGMPRVEGHVYEFDDGTVEMGDMAAEQPESRESLSELVTGVYDGTWDVSADNCDAAIGFSDEFERLMVAA